MSKTMFREAPVVTVWLWWGPALVILGYAMLFFVSVWIGALLLLASLWGTGIWFCSFGPLNVKRPPFNRYSVATFSVGNLAFWLLLAMLGLIGGFIAVAFYLGVIEIAFRLTKGKQK